MADSGGNGYCSALFLNANNYMWKVVEEICGVSGYDTRELDGSRAAILNACNERYQSEKDEQEAYEAEYRSDSQCEARVHTRAPAPLWNFGDWFLSIILDWNCFFMVLQQIDVLISKIAARSQSTRA